MTIKEKRAWGVIRYFLKFHSVQHSQKFFFENKFDKKKKKYLAVFERGYKNGNRWDEYSNFELERIDGND